MTADNDSDREITPMDLSALGPPLAPARWDAMVAGAMRASEGELARRAQPTMSRAVIAWRRPVLAVASLAVAAALVLVLVPQQPSASSASAASGSNGGETSEASTLAESIGIPGDWVRMVEGTAASVPASGLKGTMP